MSAYHNIRFSSVVQPGQRFTRLVVLGKPFRYQRMPHAVCLCDCGTVKVICCYELTSNKTRSCTCLSRDLLKQRHLTHGWCKARGNPHPLYRVWQNMLSRCYNTNVPAFASYGGRGITVCEEWRYDAAAFCEWAILNGWRHGLQIDRIDNDCGYTPNNCRFVTRSENTRNTRRNCLVTAMGETKTIASWVSDSRCTVSYATLWARLFIYKWDASLAIVSPVACTTRKLLSGNSSAV